jgi:hypothetical protein
VNGSRVPAAARPSTAIAGPRPAGAAGSGSVASATGSAAAVAPTNIMAVSAIGSRPRSSRDWATVTVEDSSSDASTSRSPAADAPPPRLPVMRPTPASDTAKPIQATGRATVRCHTAAMIATSTGTAPISRAAWLTLVLAMPAFWRRTEPP